MWYNRQKGITPLHGDSRARTACPSPKGVAVSPILCSRCCVVRCTLCLCSRMVFFLLPVDMNHIILLLWQMHNACCPIAYKLEGRDGFFFNIPRYSKVSGTSRSPTDDIKWVCEYYRCGKWWLEISSGWLRLTEPASGRDWPWTSTSVFTLDKKFVIASRSILELWHICQWCPNSCFWNLSLSVQLPVWHISICRFKV